MVQKVRKCVHMHDVMEGSKAFSDSLQDRTNDKNIVKDRQKYEDPVENAEKIKMSKICQNSTGHHAECSQKVEFDLQTGYNETTVHFRVQQTTESQTSLEQTIQCHTILH